MAIKQARESMGIHKLVFLFILATFIVAGCSRTEKYISLSEARTIANHRCDVHKVMLGIKGMETLEPRVEKRQSDTLFIYTFQGVRKKITVIVEEDGSVADTAESY